MFVGGKTYRSGFEACRAWLHYDHQARAAASAELLAQWIGCQTLLTVMRDVGAHCDCQLAIGDCRLPIYQVATIQIGNWKSAIGNKTSTRKTRDRSFDPASRRRHNASAA